MSTVGHVVFAISIVIALLAAPVIGFLMAHAVLVEGFDVPANIATATALVIVGIAEVCYLAGAIIWARAWMERGQDS